MTSLPEAPISRCSLVVRCIVKGSRSTRRGTPFFVSVAYAGSDPLHGGEGARGLPHPGQGPAHMSRLRCAALRL